MKRIFVLMALVLGLCIAHDAHAQNLTVKITQTNGTSTTVSGKASLQAALTGYTLSQVKALEISAGNFATANWTWLKTNRTALNALQDFTITAGASSVADIPVSDSLSFFNQNSIRKVSVAKVARIGDRAFYKCTSLTTATFPQATSIVFQAFKGCTSLTTASFPEATSIGESAFKLCTSLSTANFPKAISIGNWAFKDCTKLSTATFPQATSIGDQAFCRCSSLTTASFPKATSIGTYAFTDCSALTTTTFPEVTSIGEDAFHKCSSLTTVTFPKATKIGPAAFHECTALTTANFPEATELRGWAFKGCSALTTVTFPKATIIGDEAFRDCTKLTTASFPKATTLENKPFLNCTKLSTLKFGATPPTVGADSFQGCPATRNLVFVNASGTALTGEALSNAVQNYRDDAGYNPADGLWYGWQLFDINLYVTITTTTGSTSTRVGMRLPDAIGDVALGTIKSLSITGRALPSADWIWLKTKRTALTALQDFTIQETIGSVADIPNTENGYPYFNKSSLKTLNVAKVAKIGNYAFYECSALTTATFPQATSIGPYAFASCTKLSTATFPQATTIGNLAFSYCTSLTTATFPQVTTIGNWAFDGCAALASANFPKATSIGQYAFRACTKLTTATFPQVTTIGDGAFKNCTKFSTLKLGATPPTVADATAFDGCPAVRNLVFVNASGTALTGSALNTAVQNYRAHAGYNPADGLWYGWQFFDYNLQVTITTTTGSTSTRVGMRLSDAIGDVALGTIKSLSITGRDFAAADWTWLKTNRTALNALQDFTIQETIGSVADIPNTTSTEPYFNPSSLKTLNVAKVAKIGQSAFYGCTKLSTATFPQVASIGNYAFKGCTSLTTASFPQATSIGDFAFRECESLPAATFPQATSIGIQAFYKCTKLSTATFPKATSIGRSAFNGCTSLPTVNFPKATSIGDYAFKDCTKLSTATFPQVTSIDTSAFLSCTKFSTLKLGATPPTVANSNAFSGCPSPRNLVLTDASGTALTGEALSNAVQNYRDDAGYNPADGLWYGWQLFDINLYVTITTTTGSTSTRVGMRLPDAIGNVTLGTIKSLSITGRALPSADWIWLKTKRTALTALQDFTIQETIGSVADIPNTENGYPYFNKSSLKTLNVAKVAKIGNYAFYECSALTTATFPQATSIGPYAFASCTKLSTATFPQATTIGNLAFSYCTSLTTATFPQVTTIGNWAFDGCAALASANFPKATSIGQYAFRACTKLTTATFPQVTTIGDGAFKNCTKFSTLKLGATPPTVADATAFDGCPAVRNLVFVNASGTALTGSALNTAVQNYRAHAGYNPADGLWYGWQFFDYNLQVTITTTTGSTSTRVGMRLSDAIGDVALGTIKSLSITGRDFAAADWTWLKTNRTALNALQDFTIQETIGSVADIPNTTSTEPYFNPSSLKTLNVAKVAKIGQSAFYGCTKLSTATFPQVASIGNYAFKGCTSLTTASFPQATSIGDFAFRECESLPAATFPQATSIGIQAFYKCTKLSTATFPKATSIGRSAFNGCTSLPTVNFPKATSIGDYAFKDCTKLSTATFPQVTSIDTSAFLSCTKFSTLKLGATPPTVANSNAFSGCPSPRNLVLTDASGTALTGEALSNAVQNYRDDAGYNPADGLWYGWQLFDINLYVTITTTTGSTSTRVGMRLPDAIGNVTLGTIKSLSITGRALPSADWIWLKTKRTALTALQDFTIQETIGSVADIPNTENGYPYFNKSSLKTLNVAKVAKIGNYAFYECSALTTATFPQATSIGPYAFASCTKLSTATFPQATTIGNLAFSYCTSLTTATFPQVTTIGNWAFDGCAALASANFPKATSIGQYAFRACTKLTTATFPQVTTIGDGAFKNCTKFSTLKLGATPPTVADATAFDGCPAVRNLVFVNASGTALTGSALNTAVQNYRAHAGYNPADGLWYGWQFFDYNLQVTITTTTGSTSTRVGMRLSDAIGDVALGTIKSLSITGRDFAAADWTWLKTNRTALNALQDFTIQETIGSVADIPNTTSTEPYFNPSSLKTLNVAKVAKIGQSAFYGCTKLSTATFPQVASIGNYAFKGCTSLTTASFPQATSIGDFAFRECESLPAATFPQATSIGIQAFYKCTKLSTATFPKATSIGRSAFNGCTSLPTVNFPKATSIGDYAFKDCTKLSTATFPQVTSIDTSAFLSCTKFSTLKLGATPPTVANSNAFSGCPSPRNLVLTDASGTALTGEALSNAVQNYRDDAGYNPADGLWYGWQLFDINLYVTITTTTGSTSTRVGMRLPDAIGNVTLGTIKSLSITGRDFATADWTWLKTNRTALNALQDFTIQGTIGSVADIPDTYPPLNTYFNPSSLKTLNVAKVAKIGVNAFYNCTSLTTATFPQVASIGDYAFRECTALTTATFPQATTIGNTAFYKCTSLATASFPKATTIGDSAFKNCTSLTTATFPQVASIGASAFNNCTKLSTLKLGATPPTVDYSIYPYAFEGCPTVRNLVFVNASGTALTGSALNTAVQNYRAHAGYNPADGKWYGWKFFDINLYVTITTTTGSTSTRVGMRLSDAIGNVTLGTIKSLSITGRDFATADWDWLKTNRTALNALQDFTIQETIGSVADIPDTYPPLNTYFNPSSLKTLNVAKVAKIGVNAFYNCTSLTTATFPQVASIGDYAFRECTALTTATFPQATTIGNTAFYKCTSLATASFPKATTIGDSAFKNCTSLTTATFPQVASIGASAFNNCTKLSTLKLGATPPTVDYSIYPYAFEGCPTVRNLVFVNASGTALTGSALSNAVQNYRAHAGYNPADGKWYGWKFFDINLYVTITTTTGSTSTRVGMRLSDAIGDVTLGTIKSLSITGRDFATADWVWLRDNRDSINVLQNFTMQETIGSVADIPNTTSTEPYFNPSSLKTLNVAKVAKIGNAAFRGCTALTTATFPQATSIGSTAFAYCTKLSTATFPQATSIGDFAFIECESLPAANFPQATSIGIQAFYKCTKLSTATFPQVASIGNYAFLGCTKLSTATFPQATSIGRSAFNGCTSLPTVNFPKATSIGQYAFKDCTKLSTATFPQVTSIDTSAFLSCTKFSTLKLGATPPTVANSNAFSGCPSPRNLVFVNASGTALTGSALNTAVQNYRAHAGYNPADGLWYGWQFFDYNLQVTITTTTGSTSTRVGMRLSDAIGDVALGTIKSLSITGRDFATADWTWLKTNRTALNALQDFTIQETIGSVADIPNTTSTEPYFNPSSLKTLNVAKVAKIGQSAFYSCTKLSTASFPQVASIGNYAFKGCTSLTTATFPKATSIGDFAFRECESLPAANFPQVASIGIQAFYKCTKLSTATFPQATSIGRSAFNGCTSLPTVNFPKATSIGQYAFKDCTFLSTATFPQVTSIDTSAFLSCTKFSTLKLGATPPTVANSNAFSGCPSPRNLVFVNASGTALTGSALNTAVQNYRAHAGYNPADGLWYGWQFFDYNLQVTITTTTGSTSTRVGMRLSDAIGDVALGTIKSLSITGRDFATADWTWLKTNRTALNALQDFTIQETIGSVADIPNTTSTEPYFNPSSLKTLNVAKVAKIGQSAFRGCTALTTATFPQATGIGQSAFYSCTKLSTATFPQVASIGDYAFRECESLPAANFPQATSIGIQAFYKCTKLSTATFPQVASIGNYAFLGCTNLATATFPQATSIGRSAFNGCTSLPTVNFPKATSIGQYAFKDCTFLSTATFPQVTSIDTSAFLSCTKFSTLKLGATPPTVANSNAFSGCPSPRNLVFVNASGTALTGSALNTAVQNYRAHAGYNPADGLWYGWQFFDYNLQVTITTTTGSTSTRVGMRLSDAIGDVALGTIKSLSITGRDFATADWVWLRDNRESINVLQDFTMQETIGSVADIPHAPCWPTSGDSIRWKPTFGSSLQTLSVAKVKNIGRYVFGKCTSLTTASFPQATNIGRSAFRECTSLTTAGFPQATSIDTAAFWRCTSLTTATFPQATSIGRSAFGNCASLPTVNFPKATSIGNNAFKDCTFLSTATFPQATNIGLSAFLSCTKLSTATFPKATSIGDYAFKDCTSLNTIYLGATPPTVANANAFEGCPTVRYLVPTDASGTALTGTALESAIQQYKADPGYNAADDRWYGWILETYTVTVDPGITHGTLTATPNNDVLYGTTVSLTATPKPGYQLKAGSMRAYKTGSPNTAVAVTDGTFTMPAYDVTVTCEFEAITYTWVQAVTAQPAGWDPMNIDSPEDLAWFISFVNGYNGCAMHPTANGRITADLDMSAYQWVPIGSQVSILDPGRDDYYSSPIDGYEGSFDGGYHAIKGLRNDSEVVSRSGLFDNICYGTVQKVFIADCDFHVFAKKDENHIIAPYGSFGIIANSISGVKEHNLNTAKQAVIAYCVVAGKLTLDYAYYKGENPDDRFYIAGLVGTIGRNSVVHSCVSVPSLKSNGNMGGLAGRLYNAIESSSNGSTLREKEGVLRNCYTYPLFCCPDDGLPAPFFGGLVILNFGGDVQNCYLREREPVGDYMGVRAMIYRMHSTPGRKITSLFASVNINESSDGSFTPINYDIECCYMPREWNDLAGICLANFNYDNTVPFVWGVAKAPIGTGFFAPTETPYMYRHADNDASLLDPADTHNPYVNSVGYQPWLHFQDALNAWVDDHQDEAPGGLPYAKWSRTCASPVNDDYPVLLMPGANAVASDGDALYYGDVNDLLIKHLGTPAPTDDAVFLYDDAEFTTTSTMSRKVLYIGEGVCVRPDLNHSYMNGPYSYVGVTFDNSASGWDWHLFSSSVRDASLGINYRGDTTEYPFSWTNPGTRYSFYDENEHDGFFPSKTYRTGEDYYDHWDFYTYDEPSYHFINFKRNSNSHWHQGGNHAKIEYENETTLRLSKGYMMAIDQPTFMQAGGYLILGNHGIKPSRRGKYNPGYNLLGNPYQAILDFDLLARDEENALNYGSNMSYTTYDADEGGYVSYVSGSIGASTGAIVASRYISPLQGFFIYAPEYLPSGEPWESAWDQGYLNFTPSFCKLRAEVDNTYQGFRGGEEPAQPTFPLVNLIATDDNGKNDILVVEFDRPENGGARKMIPIRSGKGSLYARHQDENMSIAFVEEGITEIPVRFETIEDAVFTMTSLPANGPFRYLHLIDNITGIDHDLLADSTFTFEAKASDYKSRFKLVMALEAVEEPGDDVIADQFAYFDGGTWIVEAKGDMEVYDLTGRLLLSMHLANAQNSIDLSGLAVGLYLVRVSNGSDVKMQKIVLE